MDNNSATSEAEGSRRNPGLERLISAMVVDPALAAKVIADPQAVVDLPEYDFQLSSQERNLVLSIHGATDVYDFAARLYRRIQEDKDSATL